MENLPLYVRVGFVITTLLTLFLFYKAAGNSTRVLGISVLWLSIQGMVAYFGFYLVEDGIPPRFALLMAPLIIAIIYTFNSRKGKSFIDSLNTKYLAWLSVVRIPVELVLYSLAVYKLVPEIMTFEGINFDIFSGLTAPFIAYFGYQKKTLSNNFLMGWNIICVSLLFIIITIAVFSAPVVFQQLAFDQPNIGVMYFPFIWLPGFIVPLVLISHLTMMRKILREKREQAGSGSVDQNLNHHVEENYLR